MQCFTIWSGACILSRIWTSSASLQITPEDKDILERLVRSGTAKQRIALGARIVLGAAASTSSNALAKELQTSRPTIIVGGAA
jgi:hypothetical protein